MAVRFTAARLAKFRGLVYPRPRERPAAV